MKVLQRPPVDEWKKEVTCASCHALLELELSDLTRITGFDQRDDTSWDYACFMCPVCNRRTQSEPLLKTVPLHLRDRIGKDG